MQVVGAGHLVSGRYRLLAQIAGGGMGTVWRARDELLGRQVAVKRLAADPESETGRRISREARIGAALNHPALVAVLDTLSGDGELLIVMEYVEGETLADALERGHIAGAAIDVFPVEPQGNDARFESPLVRFDNVLLTPHIGGSTAEAQENIGREVAAKLVRYSDNGSTISAVNFPEVSLPEHEGKHRLLHIHRNRPGVMSALNGIFSEAEINISAEYLQTDAKIGYVVVDVDTDEPGESAELRRRIDAVPGTIRTRVLY